MPAVVTDVELFDTPGYLVGRVIDIRYSEASGAWNISGKNADSDRNVLTTATYGTSRINAYKILEETLNLKDVRIYDTKIDAEGNEIRVLNKKETMLATQKPSAQQVLHYSCKEKLEKTASGKM